MLSLFSFSLLLLEWKHMFRKYFLFQNLSISHYLNFRCQVFFDCLGPVGDIIIPIEREFVKLYECVIIITINYNSTAITRNNWYGIIVEILTQPIIGKNSYFHWCYQQNSYCIIFVYCVMQCEMKPDPIGFR